MPGAICKSPGGANCQNTPWFVLMLPYIEQAPLYNAFNASIGIEGPALLGYVINSTVMTSKIASFQCPSDNIQTFSMAALSKATGGFVPAYPWMLLEGELRRQLGKPGFWPGRSQSCLDPQPVSAVAVWHRPNRPGPHHDPIGLVHGWDQQYARRCGAVARSARRLPRDDLGQPRRWWFLYDAVRPQRIPGPSAHLAVPLQPWGLGGHQRGPGPRQLRQHRLVRSFGAGLQPPQSRLLLRQPARPDAGLQRPGSLSGAYAATRSRHPGGVECLFGDGSVHFIKNSINGPTWIQLGSINGGEVISSDQY